MTQEFIPYELALELKELGFDEPCFAVYENKKWFLVEVKNEMSYESCLKLDVFPAPTFSQSFRWFREKYDLHVQIRKENYVYQKVHCNYFHFDISKGEQNDITKQEDLYSNIMDECEQDIPGNYLDNEKFNILIFEKGFAFKTYEEVEIECLKKLIEIVKENKK
jgi:hypothetical protein